MKEGYSILVMNTNDNDPGIRGSQSPEKHALYVWQQYIEKSKAEHIAIVAHSYGGVCVTSLLTSSLQASIMKRVYAIALTDSVHFISGEMDEKTLKYFNDVGCNWVASDEPLDTPIERQRAIPNCVSAGHMQHEMTSYKSMNSVFKFFDLKYKDTKVL